LNGCIRGISSGEPGGVASPRPGGLRLITRGGVLNQLAHSYDDNIIVFADLVETHTAPSA
jgi:hypothetical protein